MKVFLDAVDVQLLAALKTVAAVAIIVVAKHLIAVILWWLMVIVTVSLVPMTCKIPLMRTSQRT